MSTAAPFVSRVMDIEKDWIDYNGHLNMAYYNVLFDRCSDDAFEAMALELGLADGAAEEVVRDQGRGAEVFDGALDGGDGDVGAVGDVGAQEPSPSPSFLRQVGGRRGRLRGVWGAKRGAAVDVDAPAPGAARGRGGGNVDRAFDGFEEVPERGGGAVAEDRFLAASEDGGHPASMPAQAFVSHRVDPAVDAVELTSGDAIPDRPRP